MFELLGAQEHRDTDGVAPPSRLIRASLAAISSASVLAIKASGAVAFDRVNEVSAIVGQVIMVGVLAGHSIGLCVAHFHELIQLVTRRVEPEVLDRPGYVARCLRAFEKLSQDLPFPSRSEDSAAYRRH